MTGSRAPISQAIAALILYNFFFSKQIVQFIKTYFLRWIFLIVILLLITPRLFPTALDAFKQRSVQRRGEQIERIKKSIQFPFVEMELAESIGYGIGATHQASKHLVNSMGLQRSGDAIDIFYEEEAPRIMLELGSIGFFLFYFVKITLYLVCLKAIFETKHSKLKTLMVALFLFMLVNWTTPLVFNHVLNVLFWFSVGCIFAIYHWERLEEAHLR